MTTEESRLIQEIVEGYCGVTHGLDSGFFLERRVGPRLEHLGLSSYTEYYHYLRSGPDGHAELVTLVEQLTTHETYFFREEYQLDAFREEILTDLVDRLGSRKRLSIWSAGCSTGEEVYTLAMILLDDGRFQDWHVRIVGSDISREVLAKARAARYSERSFRTTPPETIARYFEADGDYRRVADEVRDLCSFAQINLLETERYRILGSCNVIFCRNVLMYLAAEARSQVVDAFYDRLAPGGWLLLGHSESLLNVSTRFELANLEKDLVYRRAR
ncbi:MAG: protein-glutamate O-methyltransferase CheR [Myxococcales bacterium FL481]|nr:MAG: protein-glutamate O-methyltransferase CheR [Myxococcales bacterium FL481]